MHLSEDDIRTKVANEWLKDCGISNHHIFLEYTITLRLGHGEKKVNSRSDVLVKNHEGQNLLVVEVKKPDHALQPNDEAQAISYARAEKSGIAPFTILTNGADSRIYDSVTGDRIDGGSVSPTHPYVKGGFKPSGNDLKARAEALEYLISLSSENLLAFCRGQQDFRMKLLRSDDLESGKKYIPALYVEREHTLMELREKLFGTDKQKARNLLLIVGPPQHGKTCFMCHTAEQFLAEGHPTLFYPAIGLSKGLLSSIQEDFEWCFGENLQPSQWLKRLNRIGEYMNKRIFLFVDGWNEMAEKALEVNQECQRLELSHIAVILSTTSPSIPRLLKDPAGNPTFIADSIQLNTPLLNRLASEPLKDTKDRGIVQVGKFDFTETNQAKKTYASSFNVSLSHSQSLLSDPFYLRIACEQFSGGEIPADITRTQLIHDSLVLKADRRNINKVDLVSGLKVLAEVFLRNDRPVSLFKLPETRQCSQYLDPWRESAILALYDTDREPQVDFYYTHDLDYSIGILLHNWTEVFQQGNEDEVLKELEQSCQTEAGKSALRWFLGCPEHCHLLKLLFHTVHFEKCFDLPSGKILSESIVRQVTVNKKIDFQWLEPHLDKPIAMQMNENAQVSELPELLFSRVDSLDWEKEPGEYRFWMRLLVKYDNSAEEIGIEESYIHRAYGEEIRSYDGYEDTLLDTDLFIDLIFDEDVDVAKKAAYYYAYACPNTFLRDFAKIKGQLSKLEHGGEDRLCKACGEVLYSLGDAYYGYNMCKGWLLHLMQDGQQLMDSDRSCVSEEYYQMKPLLFPILQCYPDSDISESIIRILNDLREIGGVSDNDDDLQVFDPDQLKLGF